ncbi:YihY/virulence factor BrkB family protein [Schaalia sp. 19OD2882]|uniref:YhjD/YihY/BrkB family envelope integrity protein n=1 Tax=Schaalia sp. 19OD2882 TaxID=2794089 RepID=UPI001C1ED323|nr:YhjD/YihY/BrkB family envelope integrity protein [Schaalia sp. 19OD2882]QWW19155.1 YihY/virulence factor BrkB family protein [Schaalia sp. 19OD2882]
MSHARGNTLGAASPEIEKNANPTRSRQATILREASAGSFRALARALGEGTPLERLRALTQWWPNTRLARTLARYSIRNGGLLSTGMALTTLLSLTAALTAGLTVFVALLGGNDELRGAVHAGIDTALPNLLRSAANPDGLVDPDSLINSNALSLTGSVSFALAIWAALNVVGQMGSSIRSMFAVTAIPDSFLRLLARNAVGVLGIGVAFVLGAGLAVVTDLAGDLFFDTVGISGRAPRLFAAAASNGIQFLVFAAATWLLIRHVAGVRVPRRDLLWGLALTGIASLVLRMVGTSAAGAVKGPLLTTATALVTLVLWLNLQMRLVLTMCAWMANPPRLHVVTDAASVHFVECPNYVTVSAPHTLLWPHNAASGDIVPTGTRGLDARPCVPPQTS